MHKERLGILLFFLLSAGCSKTELPDMCEHIKNIDNLIIYQADTKPGQTFRFVKEWSFGSTDQAFSGNISTIAVDKAGRVYAGDPYEYTVHIIEADGSYLSRLGREGKGPGEFVVPPLPAVVSDRLFLYDARQFRVSVYSIDSLSFSHTINLNPKKQGNVEELEGFHMGKLYFINNDTFLVRFEQPRNLLPGRLGNDNYSQFYLMNSEGTIISDKIFEQKVDVILSATAGGEFRVARFPFTAKPLIAVSENGYIFSAWSEKFLIEVYDFDRNHHAFYYPYDKIPLTREAAIKSRDNHPDEVVVEQSRIIIRHSDDDELPETWPALNDMLIGDENRLWISTIVDDFEVYQWWVLQETGELLARFNWPRSKQIEVVKNNKLYTRETDKETGLQKIVRYRIEMK